MRKLLLILLCLPFIGLGQGWEKTYGGTLVEGAKAVQQTTDGGYIIAGRTSSFGNGYNDVYLIKTDSNGIEQWNQTFGGTNEDAGNSVQQTTDGGYIICGNTESFGNGGDVYLVKTNSNGIEQWNKTFGGSGYDVGYSVQQTTDGGYIIAAAEDLFNNGGGAYLLKTNDNGIEQWSQSFSGQTSFSSVQQTNDGGYIATGTAIFWGNDFGDFYTVKTDANGIEQWSEYFGEVCNINSTERSYSIQQTNDGGYIICGNACKDVLILKRDSNGNVQWSSTFPTGGSMAGVYTGNSIQQTNDGGYIITGYSNAQNGASSNMVYLIKTDSNGIEHWSKNFGIGTGFSVQQTTDGGYIIAGETVNDVIGAGNNFYLIKTDGNGNATSTFNIPINPNRKLQKTIDMLGKETKPKSNTPLIEIYDDGTVEKRIVIE